MSTLTNENGGRPSLADKLLACDAISSLDQELRIARILRALKWQANVGHYYNDPVEGKDRELDIFASQRWCRGPRRDRRRCQVQLLVECKTLHGYNIILAPEDDNCDVLPEHLDYFWPGSQYDQDEDKERDSVLRQLLADAKTTAVDTRRFFQDFTRYAYPRNYMRLGDFCIDPMRAHYSGCAFRETNSEKTKDLDASVVWKSGRALKSAITSVKKSRLKWTLSFYHSTAEHTQQRKNNIVEALIKEYKNMLNAIDIFLPVLVVDCRLWTYDVTTKLREVEWLRIHQRDHVGISTFWFDVVSMAKAQDYLESLTKNIETSLRAVHARPQRENVKSNRLD